MPEPTRVLIFLFLGVIIFAHSAELFAADLRGQVMGENYRKELVPRRGVRVELVRDGDNTTISKVISGVSGTFYFYSIPPGKYQLKVNGKSNRRFTVRNDDFMDLGQVVR